MKKLTILALMLAFAWGASAQFYMHVWYNDSLFTFPVLKVDSVTFTDKWLEPGEPVEPEPETPSEGIGVFSVSADKKVTFSPGNLQYHPANDEWRFAENQLDYIGDANSNISSSYNGWLDLFGWSANNTTAPFGVSISESYSDYSGSFVDWGTNKIGSDAPNTWRTLTYDEWYYLRYTRTNADALCGVAQVNGVNGLILLPDNWTFPDTIAFKFGFHNSNRIDDYAAYQTFTADQWSKLEVAGAVFLPASGIRSGSSVPYVQSLGRYWSATEYNNYYAGYLCFSSQRAYMEYNYVYLRDSGFSVRLVKDVERGGATPDTPDTPTEPEEPETPSAGIGVFSVSADKQVTFSKGNLQYTQSTNTWAFAENQWDMIGTDNVIGDSVSSSPTYGDDKYGTALADKIDLFVRSTSATNWGVSTSTDYNDYSGYFVDWGKNKIGSDAPNTWRTLTKDEWNYLFNNRPNASSLKGIAQVNGVNGLIFLPDNWVCPSGVTFKSGFHSERGVDYYAAYQTFTADQWSKLESAGAVFLPAAGCRGGSDVYFVQNDGSYWSATEVSSYFAGSLYFGSSRAHLNGYGYDCFNGFSVRLVKDL